MNLKPNLNFKGLVDSSSQPNKLHIFNEQIIYSTSQTPDLKKKKKKEFNTGLRTNIKCNYLFWFSKLTQLQR